MKPNMGLTDRVIRILLAAVVGGLIATGVLKGVLANVLGVVAVVFVLTSVVSVCPLYGILKLSTRPKAMTP